ncbi:MAG TPA: type IV secretion system protein, partial [Luteolibacter sp.]
MKTTLSFVAISAALAASAMAQIPVTDAASIGSNQANWLDNVAKWKTSFDKANSQIQNQKQQIARMNTELKRMGDPASLV